MFYVEILSHTDNQVSRLGEFEDIAAAISAACRIIDDFLQAHYVPDMRAEALYSIYEAEGNAPLVFQGHGLTINVPEFNHITYAKTRAKELCEDK